MAVFALPHYLLAVIALVLAGFSLWDYKRNSNSWTIRGKIWIRTAVIFGVMAGYLMLSR